MYYSPTTARRAHRQGLSGFWDFLVSLSPAGTSTDLFDAQSEAAAVAAAAAEKKRLEEQRAAQERARLAALAAQHGGNLVPSGPPPPLPLPGGPTLLQNADGSLKLMPILVGVGVIGFLYTRRRRRR